MRMKGSGKISFNTWKCSIYDFNAENEAPCSMWSYILSTMRLRFLLIGGINAGIAIALLVGRGYSEIFVGYMAVSLIIAIIGLFLK